MAIVTRNGVDESEARAVMEEASFTELDAARRANAMVLQNAIVRPEYDELRAIQFEARRIRMRVWREYVRPSTCFAG